MQRSVNIFDSRRSAASCFTLRRARLPTLTRGGERPTQARGTVVLPYIEGTADRIGRMLRDFQLKVFFTPGKKIASMLHTPTLNRPSADNTTRVVNRFVIFRFMEY